MTHKEAQMLALGARLIEKGGAVKTATQSEGEREASTSVLAMCTANVSEAYQTAIDWCARYLDLKPAADATTYQINQEFTEVANDPLTITALVGAWQAGIMAMTDVRAYFRRQGTIATERTDEAIDADLAIDPPPDPNAPGDGASDGSIGGPGSTPAATSSAASHTARASTGPCACARSACTAWCVMPSPRMNRPPDARLTVSARCAICIGCWFWIGTTPLATSIVSTSCNATARMVRRSGS
jgi:hypothetical protein